MLKKFTNLDIDTNFGMAKEFNSEWVSNGSYLMFFWNDGSNRIQLSRRSWSKPLTEPDHMCHHS